MNLEQKVKVFLAGFGSVVELWPAPKIRQPEQADPALAWEHDLQAIAGDFEQAIGKVDKQNAPASRAT
jgi:hypothetical protein